MIWDLDRAVDELHDYVSAEQCDRCGGWLEEDGCPECDSRRDRARVVLVGIGFDGVPRPGGRIES